MIAVPQVPLDAFQFPLDRVRFLVVMVGQSPGALSEHGEPHGQMEPVENVLGTGGHIRRQVPDRVAAVGQERDVLIHLQALFAQHLMQAPLWPVVEALDETEVTVVAVLRDGLASRALSCRISPWGAADFADSMTENYALPHDTIKVDPTDFGAPLLERPRARRTLDSAT